MREDIGPEADKKKDRICVSGRESSRVHFKDLKDNNLPKEKNQQKYSKARRHVWIRNVNTTKKDEQQL